MSGLFGDLGYALRQLRNRPGFTALAVLTLSLGIGAATAVFSMLDAVLLRPLPYQDSSRLVAIWSSELRNPGTKIFAPYRDFQEFKSRSHSVEALAAVTWARAGEILTWRGSAHQVLAIPATVEFFSLLGIPAAMGHTFAVEDQQRGCTVVLAHSFWQTDLGSPADIVGSALVLSGQPCTVIGVMPPGFEFYPKQTSLWTLITPASKYEQKPFDSEVGIFGRLRPGVTVSSAERELVALHQPVVHESPAGSWVAETTPIVRELRREFTWMAGRNLRTSVFILSGAVALLLLIACLNVAHLLLIRSDHRQRELAIRTALGSDHSRIVRFLLIESWLISCAGAIGGILLTTLALGYFNSASPIELPAGTRVGLNLEVVLFSVALALLSGLLCAWIPARRVLRVELNEVLKQSARTSLGTARTSSGFVVGQASLSMIMLVAAGLMIESLLKLSSVPLGLEPQSVLTAEISLPASSYPTLGQRAAFYSNLLAGLAVLPGVEQAALCSALGPYNGDAPASELTLEGRPPFENLEAVSRVEISDHYFRALGMARLRGRDFDGRDRADSQPVAIVNQEFVRTYLPQQDPLGQQIKLGKPGDEAPWLTIVGVVGSEKRTTVYQEMSYVEPALVYLPLHQASGTSMGLVLKTAGNPLQLSRLLPHQISQLDPSVPVYDLRTMNQRYSEFLAYPRFRALLMGILAGLTLMLAAVGFYGVLAYTVTLRTQEIGVRMALGARKEEVLRAVVLRGTKLAFVGVGSGTIAGLLLSRTVSSLLYGLGPNDPATFALSALLLISVALAACYIPGRRAANVDPMVALRYE